MGMSAVHSFTQILDDADADADAHECIGEGGGVTAETQLCRGSRLPVPASFA